MTNVEIINNEAIKLAEAGIINYDEIGIPEELHTYAAWKNLVIRSNVVKKLKLALKFGNIRDLQEKILTILKIN